MAAKTVEQRLTEIEARLTEIEIGTRMALKLALSVPGNALQNEINRRLNMVKLPPQKMGDTEAIKTRRVRAKRAVIKEMVELGKAEAADIAKEYAQPNVGLD